MPGEQHTEERSPSAEADDSRVSILLVDDRSENLLALSAILENPEYRLVQAGSGRDALRQILETDFAVIVLDVFMPGMDGFEVASTIKLRPRSRHTPIIFLTAAGEDVQLLGHGYAVGAVDYLTKPVNSEILRAKVAVFVDLFRKSREIARQAELLRIAERRERDRERADLERANEVRYQRLADSIPHIVWRADKSGVPTYVNRRWREFTGKDSPKGIDWQGVVHAEDRERFRRAWSDALADDSRAEIEVRLTGADGTARWHLFRALPESDQDGKLTGWLGTFTDIEDEKAAQSVLEAENRRSAIIAGTSAFLDVAFDVPEILQKVTGRAVPELAEASVLDLWSASDKEMRREAVSGPTLSPAAREAISKNAKPDAGALVLRERRPMLLTDPDAIRAHLGEAVPSSRALLVPLVARGHAFGVLTLLRDRSHPDFTAQDRAIADEFAHRAALAIDNARLFREAIEAVSARDEFLSIASHELKTPLTSMGLHVQSLLRRASSGDGVPAEVLTTKLDASYRQVLRLEALVDQLLDVTRIVSGNEQQRIEEVDLVVALTNDVVGRLSEHFTRAACEITVNATDAVVGRWDRSRIEQVLSNLLSNAVKYGPGKPIDVTVSGESGRARVQVRDQGIGIARDQQSRIFERFERAVSPRQYGGLGLGLYIARHIVEAHGGLIRVESAPGQGSCFTFELPCEAVDTHADDRTGARGGLRVALPGRRAGGPDAE